MNLFHRRRRRIAAADREAEKSKRIGQMLDRQWPEVRQLSEWARETRERNHLTELFLAGRGK